jgi:hypothetical protein
MGSFLRMFCRLLLLKLIIINFASQLNSKITVNKEKSEIILSNESRLLVYAESPSGGSYF